MNHASKIFVAGHRGLAGSALVRELRHRGFDQLLLRTHAELDLEDATATRKFFDAERPQVVFLAAAKVGGILANNTYPVDFLLRNLLIEANVIRAGHEAGVERLIFLGSSCIYPREAPVPIKESALLTGPLEATNRPYALAKIAGIELCWAFNRQYGTRFLAAMPTNLYGPGDSYDLANSHVLPALIRKVHEAKRDGRDEVVLWGSGKPRREFLYADDLARALVFLADLDEARFAGLTDPAQCPLINVGTGEDLEVSELAALIAEVIGWRGRFVHDTSKPDGTLRKVMDVSRLRALGWAPATSLREGIALAYRDFLSR
ncbi:MAG: GDP-L-fucose synthase [Burkholderiaceae bacterium]|nr:GDP-L-fucose synthase [Burkholderiaceae bacterium]